MKRDSIGAINVIRSQRAHPMFDVEVLFPTDGLAATRARFDYLGLSWLLTREKIQRRIPSDISDAVCQALGCERADWKSSDIVEQEAAFLTAFAWLHFRAGLSDPEGEGREHPSQRPATIDLGRLIEFWRWRSEGVELQALHGQRMRGGNVKPANRKRSENRVRTEDRLIRAARIALKRPGAKFKNGRINVSGLGRECVRILGADLPIEERWTREILKKAIREGKLAG